MFKTCFLVAIRNLLKNKSASFINILEWRSACAVVCSLTFIFSMN